DFDGRVQTVYPKAEVRDNVVDYITVVRFPPPAGYTLRAEMTTTVRITTEAREQVLAVPIRAVRRQDGRTFVLLRRGGATERRWVITGARDDASCEIVDGLHEGDEVLVGEAVPEGGRD